MGARPRGLENPEDAQPGGDGWHSGQEQGAALVHPWSADVSEWSIYGNSLQNPWLQGYDATEWCEPASTPDHDTA